MRKMCFNILALVMIVSLIIPAPVVFAAPAAQTPTYIYTGTVVDPSGLPLSNVEITWQMNGIDQEPTYTNAAGSYQLIVDQAVDLSIQPRVDGYNFWPPYYGFSFVFFSEYQLDFQASGNRSVSGQVISMYSFCQNDAVIGFAPASIPPELAVPITVTTSSTENTFSLSGLEPILYRVTYERPGCVPVERLVELNAEPTMIDFFNVEAEPVTLSGTVKLPNGTAPVGASVSYLVNGITQVVPVLPDGSYTLTGVRYSDSVMIYPPSISGYQFSPPSHMFIAVDADQTDLDFQAAGTRVISGRIINSFAADANPYCFANVPMVFAPVNPLQGNSHSISTDADGFFSITTLEPIAYELQISHPGCRYLNIPVVFPPNPIDIPSYTIAAWQDKYTISGRVTTGTPPAGVVATVHVTGTAADAHPLDFTTTTDSDGYYTLDNTFDLNDRVTVQFTSDAYTFSPASIPLGPIQSDFTGQNSTATLNTYTVAGIVTLPDFTTPVAGVTLNFNGQTTTSDSLGRYQFLNVPHGTTATVTASLPNFSFIPYEISITNLTGNIDETGPNGWFTAYPNANISGKITYKGAPVAGVTVSFNLLTATTAADGTYQFASIPPGTTGEIVPSLAGYIFAPEKIAVVMPGIDPLGAGALTGQDFTAVKTLSLKGKVVAKDGTTPLPGVTFQYGAYSAVSGMDGTYTISGIPEGTSSTLIPRLAGYRFVPEKTNLTLTKNTTVSTVTKGIRLFVISGHVTGEWMAVNGVTISLGKKTTLSAPDGSFSLAGVDEGTSGTLLARKTGYHFIPENFQITSLNADMPVTDFAIVPNQYTLSGIVLYKGNPLSGIIVTLNGSDSSTLQAVTGKNGRYSFKNIVYGVQYQLVATGIGYNLAPWIYMVPLKASNQKLTITATVYQRTIFGSIGYSDLAAMNEKVRIYYGSGANDYAVPNYDGTFTLPKMPGNKTVTIRPWAKNYVFMPPTIDLPPSNAFLASVGFGMMPSKVVSGTVTVAGKPVPGAEVTFMGIFKTRTNALGKYRLQIPIAVGQPLIVEHPYFHFLPQIYDFTNGTTVNWKTATVIVSGQLLDTNGLAAAGTVRVSATQFAPVLPDGTYSLEVRAVDKVNLWNFILRPEVPLGYHSNPATITVSPGRGASNKNFTVAPNTWTVSGKVTYNGKALAGVTVTDTHSGRKGVTDAYGAYRITSLKFNAPVLLRATKTGYTFSEPSEFIMGDAKVTGQNITAVR